MSPGAEERGAKSGEGPLSPPPRGAWEEGRGGPLSPPPRGAGEDRGLGGPMSPPPMSPPPREAQRVDNRTDAQKALLGLAVQQSYTREIQVLTHKRCPSVDTQERSQCSHTREIQVLKDFRVVTQKRPYLRYILLLTHKRGPCVIYKKYHFVDIQDKSLCYTPEISLCCYSREVIKITDSCVATQDISQLCHTR